MIPDTYISSYMKEDERGPFEMRGLTNSKLWILKYIKLSVFTDMQLYLKFL